MKHQTFMLINKKGKDLLDAMYQLHLKFESGKGNIPTNLCQLPLLETDCILTKVQDFYQSSNYPIITLPEDKKFFKLNTFILQIEFKKLFGMFYSITSCLHSLFISILNILCTLEDSSDIRKLTELTSKLHSAYNTGCTSLKNCSSHFDFCDRYGKINVVYRDQKYSQLGEPTLISLEISTPIPFQKLQDIITTRMIDSIVVQVKQLMNKSAGSKGIQFDSSSPFNDIHIVQTDWEQFLQYVFKKSLRLSNMALKLSKLQEISLKDSEIFACSSFPTERQEKKAFKSYMLLLMKSLMEVLEDLVLWNCLNPLSLCDVSDMQTVSNNIQKIVILNPPKLKLLSDTNFFLAVLSICLNQCFHVNWDLHNIVLVFACWNPKVSISGSFSSNQHSLIDSFKELINSMTEKNTSDKQLITSNCELEDAMHNTHLHLVLVKNWIDYIEAKLDYTINSRKFAEYILISHVELPEILPFLRKVEQCANLECPLNIFDDLYNTAKLGVEEQIKEIHVKAKEIDYNAQHKLQKHLKKYFLDFFHSNLPKGNYWRKAEHPINPSAYMQAVIGLIKEFIYSIELLSEENQIGVGGILVLSICDTLLETFQRNKQYFSLSGAKHLDKDLSCLKTWLTNHENLSRKAREWMINHDSMKECQGIVKILSKPGRLTLGNNKVIPVLEDNIPLEIYVSNQAYWLSHRTNSSHRCCC